jgi:BirA family transcriptional regulator, biotin operon repressor / biotin---[acetyl-CoA-carboxylase] ligase
MAKGRRTSARRGFAVGSLREFHAVLPSTQLRAAELARAGAPSDTRVVAARQSAGRGRLDHPWASPVGGLYLSVLVRPPRQSEALLPLAVGSELAFRLRDRWEIAARIKWPNDLWIARVGSPPAKLGGVLVDEVGAPAAGRMAVVGIGLNVARPAEGFPEDLRVPPVTLEELVDRPPSLADVEDVAAESASAAARGLDAPDGDRHVLERCRSLLFGVGQRGSVDGTARGRIRTIADDGALVMEVDGVPTAFRAGDLTVEGS